MRATYDRMDALSRSVFWASEQQADPTDAVAGVKLAQALRELGRYDQAAEAAQVTLNLKPTDLDALLELGRAHIARGQAFYGVAPLEKARDLAPRDWRPYSLLGVAYEQVRRFDDARAAWNQALVVSPDNPDVLANAATAALTHGDAPGAEALLRRAAAQPTASAKVRQNLALALGLQGKMGEAEQILRRELPPEQAEQNLNWLRARSAPGATAAAAPPQVAASVPGSDTARTWNSLQGG
ncbi:tetratricopeptide repeat protein [Brevundimonas sp. SORGH_AS_0993]|uniref:tetratricopeptide repeat protein n=1 Tax=Brevundimonas sp. SORGH_AS_0993 TaxID=3041794 RepID=UPI002788DDF9|nr:tetratricopeptide repeat protein [Brevundimonas sp. SORGH_AS_0993]MDQ1154765.1 Flp pilus assembly protein TadD [Brevundimonas sp. SORGH_AS_0993]